MTRYLMIVRIILAIFTNGPTGRREVRALQALLHTIVLIISRCETLGPDIAGHPVPAAAVNENETAEEFASTHFNGSQCYSAQDVPDTVVTAYVSVPLAPDTSAASENVIDRTAHVRSGRATKRKREDDAGDVSGPRSVPFRAEQEDNLPGTNPLECRMSAITEAIGFRPTDLCVIRSS